jgi:hypothetical protein
MMSVSQRHLWVQDWGPLFGRIVVDAEEELVEGAAHDGVVQKKRCEVVKSLLDRQEPTLPREVNMKGNGICGTDAR